MSLDSTTTPLMKQYKEIKDNYQNEILFFRLGDFYEMFYNDAVITSKVLGLTLTKRNKEKGTDIPLAGIPYHSASQYISKLVNEGYKVAICEQVEDPKEAKGIVKREVIKVITPGTVIDVDTLDSKSNNFILSVIIEQDTAYISYVDITTGLFNTSSTYINDLYSYLYKLNVKEIITNKQTHSRISEYTQKQKISTTIIEKVKNSGGFLTQYFNITSLDSFGLFDKGLIDSCAILLQYVLETQVNVELNIPKISVISKSNYADINMSTAKNLEIIKNQRDNTSYGTLLWILDKCKTSMGTRLLKSFLNLPLIDLDKIQERQTHTKYLIDNILIREEIRDELENVYDIERLLSKLIFGNENAKDLIAIKSTFKSCINIYNKWSEMFSDIDFTKINELINLIDTSIVDEPPFSVREGGMIKPEYNDELSELHNILTNGKDILVNIEMKEKEQTGIKNLRIKYNRIFGYFIEISNSNISEVPDRYIRKQTLSNCERYITQELKEYEDKILNAKARNSELEYKLFKDISEKIKEHKDLILDISKIISYIDVIGSFAYVSLTNGYTLPIFNQKGEIQILNGRHPVVEKLINEPFIENDVHFTENENFIILTGPNMAGKSTYMKQIALICIMAQIGMYVPAASANLSIIDKFLTRIGASDDIITGQSTFMVEMSEVANILNNATKKSLIILDEVGRGTSTYDGLSIATAISTYIHDKIGANTIFATHYHELNELEDKYDKIVNYRINVEEKNSKVIFLRTISKGSADRSYGNYVAKLAGLPYDVLKESKKLLKKLENRHILIQKHEDIGQLSLFDNMFIENEEDNKEQLFEDLVNLKEEIANIDINSTTPVKALLTLEKLKELVNNIDK
ncbi:DNA mismatch repair protein MutS [Caviibacter abscessus]|uniref:DNA mismatch repair protein MutS n=1 Tax=Caviibacter abscessus TaxID=1766719 RepID=UPI00082A12B2|nr:DNA mismatch repair protein MutS [Caviibacter abscessus]